MFQLTPHPSLFTGTSKLGLSSAFLLLCTACGGGAGGGNTSSSTPTGTVNQPPVISTKSPVIVTESQPFTLDASGSSDIEGADLSFDWRQLSGPEIQIQSADQPKVSMIAPALEADQDLSFEVTISDGTNTVKSTMSLTVENLKTSIVQSESTQYGTGGPTNPAQTIPDPSIYEGNKPLDRIIGLTAEADGGYRVHWSASNGGQDMPISSQAFTVEGEKTGPQTDGVFLGGDQTSQGSDDQPYKFTYGVTFATVQSGDALFNLNAKLEFGQGFSIGYTSYRGLVDGEVEGFGDTLIEQAQYTQKTMGGAYAPIGSDKVLLTLSERTTEAYDDPEAVVQMKSYVVDKSGQVLMHDLGEYASNATPDGANRMTVTSYDGGASFLTAWSQNTEDAGFDIRMQRSTENGILLGVQETVNTEASGHQLNPLSTTLSGGNIVVSWLNHIEGAEGEPGGREIRARVVQPNGSFASDAMSLGPVLQAVSEETAGIRSFYQLTPLKTDEVLLTWLQQELVEGEGTPFSEVRALVLDSELQVVSNEFTLASGVEAENISNILAVTLPDNRVVMGWHNNYPYAQRDENPDTSHTVGFYPVGKE